jgi:HlyD family secretion protein
MMDKLHHFHLKVNMIIRAVVVPMIAVAGIASALRVIHLGAQNPPAPPAYSEPAAAPYSNWISGAGTVEPFGDASGVTSPVNGVVEELYVVEGATVKKGSPLLKIEAKDFEAEKVVREAGVQTALAELAEAERSLRYYRSVKDKRAISSDTVAERAAQVAVAKARVLQSEALVNQSKVEIERRIVRSPIAGEVLRIQVELGEFAGTQTAQQSLLMIGDTTKLQVRVQIDETEAWRVAEGAKASAVLRGSEKEITSITFIRIEPLVVPKQALVGDSNERVDTRVLEVIYSLEKDALPVRPGQLVDVFVEVY